MKDPIKNNKKLSRLFFEEQQMYTKKVPRKKYTERKNAKGKRTIQQGIEEFYNEKD